MKVVRYFYVGVTAAATDIVVFGVLVKIFGMPWFTIAILSFILATIINYILSVRYVFESGVRFSRQHEIFLVFIVSAIGLILNQIVLWVLIERSGWDALLAKVLATGSVFFWNYGARRNFIFKQS